VAGDEGVALTIVSSLLRLDRRLLLTWFVRTRSFGKQVEETDDMMGRGTHTSTIMTIEILTSEGGFGDMRRCARYLLFESTTCSFPWPHQA
jgi:hypothetical protein